MRLLTPSLLVTAVTELSKDELLVRATDVFAWCERNAVDYRGTGLNNQAIWDADHEEARGQHRLLKFKRGTSRQARVAWALAAYASKVRGSAESLGWRELNWDGESWAWLKDGEG